jgi:hypothetical protein
MQLVACLLESAQSRVAPQHIVLGEAGQRVNFDLCTLIQTNFQNMVKCTLLCSFPLFVLDFVNKRVFSL